MVVYRITNLIFDFMNHPVTIALKALSIISFLVGLFFLMNCIGGKNLSDNLIYGISGIFGAIFNYGFAFIVEAARLYVEKEHNQKKKNYQY